jgi:hypothetical protein
LSTIEDRRNRRIRDRDQSRLVRDVFPNFDLLRLDLTFTDANSAAPSAQSFSLYPSARAFFRFACPCLDCDGEFDVSDAVSKLAITSRRGNRSGSAQQSCEGKRARDRLNGLSCPIKLDCHIVMTAAG